MLLLAVLVYLLFVYICVINLNIFVCVPVVITVPCLICSGLGNNMYHSLLSIGKSIDSIFIQVILVLIGIVCLSILAFSLDKKLDKNNIKIIIKLSLLITLFCLPLLFLHFFVLAPVIAFVMYSVFLILHLNKFINNKIVKVK